MMNMEIVIDLNLQKYLKMKNKNVKQVALN